MTAASPPRALNGGVLMTIHRLSQGGADRVAMLLANGFVAAGVPTAIAMLRSGGEGEQALLALLDPRVVVCTAGSPLGSRHLELVRGLGFIRRQIAAKRPALVLASSSNMGLVTGIAARLQRGRGPRFAMKLTNPVIRPRDRGALREAYRRTLFDFIFGSFGQVLVLTDAERTGLSYMFPRQRERFVTVANPYVTGEFVADADHSARPGGGHIVTLARMMPQKRLDRLLDAFAHVTRGDARLTIFGDGPERPRLERLARDLGVAGRVAMPGFVEDASAALRTADLFVLSSDYEGLPAAAIEALACNVPVVTTDCCAGARELLAGAAGCAVVPVDDVAALAAAIDRGLAAGRSADLRPLAEPYGVDAAIAAHLRVLIDTPNTAIRSTSA